MKLAERPPATGLTTDQWRYIAPIMVPVKAVLRCQPYHKKGGWDRIAGPSACGDPYSHVVVVDGVWMLEDGHHRHQAAMEAGEEFWPARVFVSAGDRRR